MRRLVVAGEQRHLRHRQRRLLDQKVGRNAHAPGDQMLAEAFAAELRKRALQLTRRGGKSARHARERQLLAIVTLDDDARQQVQPAARGER